MDGREENHPYQDRDDGWAAPGGWIAPGGASGGGAPGDRAAGGAAPDGRGVPRAPDPGRHAPPRDTTGAGAPPPHGHGDAPPAGAEPPDAPAVAEPREPRDWWGGAEGGGTAPPAAESVRRLSPRSMVVGPINQLRGLLLPIAAGLVLGGFNAWVLAATGATVVALLVGGFVTWRTTRYQVAGDRLEIRRGLLHRSQRTIPLERVRGVDVTSTLLHRLLGVAVVRVEAAAGSAGATEDGKLDAVETAEADRLRRVLLHRRAVLTGQHAGTVPGRDGAREPEEGAAEDGNGDGTVTYFTMPPSWYLYGALSLGYLLTPFAVLATLSGMVQQTAGERAADYLVDWVADADPGFLVVLATASAVALVLLMPVFAVTSYAFTHWGFTLRGRDGSLVAERGLFTRRSVTLERRRIRGYEILDTPLERTRGAVRLRAIVTGLGDTANRAVLLPTGDRARVEEVVDRALALFGGRLRRHPRAALYRRLTRAVAPFAAVLAVALALDVAWLAWAAGALAVLGVPLGVDRYRSLGHGYDGERVSVRSGSLRREQATVERSAVIGWTWTQTLFQRRSGLADLQVTVGAGAGGYTVQDASLPGSVDFAARVTPGMVRPFLVDSAEAGGRVTGGG
ncbi:MULTISPECIES: PH domain-containing protein [unclassified Nocardiopsis]|uniref:PH domain-containing protein n=1 Tax=unclassified Nocardiopsis TaxID=2649073 RepID=UPI0019166AF8|nr:MULTISPECIES: PH domain-containing protein [unclassified Nocardiopsis]